MATILEAVDLEIVLLKSARDLLASSQASESALAVPKRKYTPRKKHNNLSPEGRARIVAALKARWANTKKK